jgi:transcription elongation factor Elf1
MSVARARLTRTKTAITCGYCGKVTYITVQRALKISARGWCFKCRPCGRSSPIAWFDFIVGYANLARGILP